MFIVDKLLLAFQIVVAVGVVIFVHELGHFLMARYRGVKVEKFSLGFGPRLFGFKRGDTDYMVSLFFFFGGFVKMAGEEPNTEMDAKDKKFEKWEYFGQPWWSRCLIVVAGPLMNFVFAYIVFVLLMSVAVKVPDFSPIVGTVEANSIAAKAGFKIGDEVLSVDGKNVKTWSEIQKELKKKNDATLSVKTVTGKTSKIHELKLNFGADEALGLAPFVPPVLPIVDSVSPGSPAYSAGINEGDEIFKIDGKPISVFSDIGKATVASEGKELVFSINRAGKTIERKVKPMKDTLVTNRYIIGISAGTKAPFYTYERINFFRALKVAGEQVYSISKLQLLAIYKLATGKMPVKESVGGPIMIVQSAASMAKKGMNEFIFFFAFVSVALGLFNLIIPIPVVDSGVLLLFILEGIRGKPLSFKVQTFLAQAGFFLLIALAVLVSYNDIARMITRNLIK